MQVRPWGFWKPIHTKTLKFYPDFQPNRNFKMDFFNVVIGVFWQNFYSSFLPISLVTQQHTIFYSSTMYYMVMSIILKFTWWNKLDAASKETLPADFDQRIKT